MPLFDENELWRLKCQIVAIFWNLYDWFLSVVLGLNAANDIQQDWKDVCVVIERPGSAAQLQFREIPPGYATLGYNLLTPTMDGGRIGNVFVDVSADSWKNLPQDTVLLKNRCFSINYADCCIRWGLYESANKFVGLPMVPGFDVAGEVEWVGSAVTHLSPGDRVFGASLFGAYFGTGTSWLIRIGPVSDRYSTKILVPARQLRKIPASVGAFHRAAALPSVAFTAIHALNLAGLWPRDFPGSMPPLQNNAVLVHSAAGGVGSLLCLLGKRVGAFVVGVVGSDSKIKDLKKLGACEEIRTKSGRIEREPTVEQEKSTVARQFCAVFDANGPLSYRRSYDALAQGGRLIVYGCHEILPTSTGSLSPTQWLKMAYRFTIGMPAFNPMPLISDNKAVLGFNLSFMAAEVGMLEWYFDALIWHLEDGLLTGRGGGSTESEGEGAQQVPKVEVFALKDVRAAHGRISSGLSVGKLVVDCGA